jgi:hypothetical protein
MNFIRYYAALLCRDVDMAPTMEEAQQDFRRVADLNQVALAYAGF